MKYVIYTRISKAKKKDGEEVLDPDELSLESQEADCIKYCRGKPFIVFKDKGKGGGLLLEKRLKLLEAIDTLQKGDVLLCLKPDRLARSDEVAAIKYFLRQKKARLEYADGTKVDLDDPTAVLMEDVKNMFAKWEKSQISARTVRALQTLKEKNERYGTIPFGYKVDADGIKLIRNHDEMLTLNRMCQLFEERYSFQRISEILTKEGYRNREGNPFQRMGIWKILKRIGKTRYEDQFLEELALV